VLVKEDVLVTDELYPGIEELEKNLNMKVQRVLARDIRKNKRLAKMKTILEEAR
jgi:hypothetical protein